MRTRRLHPVLKHHRRSAAVPLLACALCAASCAEDPAPKKTDNPAPKSAQSNPEPAPKQAAAVPHKPGELFVQHCSPCHGFGGRGDGAVVSMLEHKPRDFVSDTWAYVRPDADERAEVIRIIREGIEDRGMSGFDQVLTDNQISTIANDVLMFRTGFSTQTTHSNEGRNPS